MTLGIPFNDIASIMISDGVDKLNSMTFKNRLYGENTSISSILKKFENEKYNILYELGFDYKDALIKFVGNKYDIKDDQLLKIEFKLNNIQIPGQKSISYKDFYKEIKKGSDFKFDTSRIARTEEEVEIALEIADAVGESDPEFSSKTTSRDKVKLLKALEDTIEMSEFIKEFKNDINFNTFLKGYKSSKEITLLGRLFSLNQGIKPKFEDRYAFSKIFQTLFQDRLDDYLKGPLGNDIYKHSEIVNRASFYTKNGIDIDEFLSNTEYADNVIESYNMIKDTYNVFDVMYKLPQYRSFLKAFSTESKVSQYGSYKESLFRSMVEKLESKVNYKEFTFSSIDEGEEKPTKKIIKSSGILNKDQLKSIRKFADEVMIKSFFDDSNIEIEVGKGQAVYENYKTVNSKTGKISLNTSDGLASFKLYMEQVVFPSLKQAMQDKENLKNNTFIKHLYISSRPNDLTNALTTYYRLSDNMMNINQDVLDDLTASFRSIKDVKLDGKNRFGDLLFLYNLIIHKDGVRQDSFNKILNGMSDDKTSMSWKYNQFIGEMDWNTSPNLNLDNYNIDDLLLYITPLIGTQEASSMKSPYTKRISNGMFVYRDSKKETIININSNPDYTFKTGVIKDSPQILSKSKVNPMNPFRNSRTFMNKFKNSIIKSNIVIDYEC